jgi:hypothetical protein
MGPEKAERAVAVKVHLPAGIEVLFPAAAYTAR